MSRDERPYEPNALMAGKALAVALAHGSPLKRHATGKLSATAGAIALVWWTPVAKRHRKGHRS